MSNIMSFLVGVVAAFMLLVNITPDEAMPGATRNKLNICEKSLPRDQKCIIVAVPPEKAKLEQKALNEIKGEIK